LTLAAAEAVVVIPLAAMAAWAAAATVIKRQIRKARLAPQILVVVAVGLDGRQAYLAQLQVRQAALAL
jgi:hypothetical protein